MSYILDALKKSEQERGHGSIPGVQTIHSSSLNYNNEKKSAWPLLLVALVFINIAVLVYFILMKEQSETITDTMKSSNSSIAPQQSPALVAKQTSFEQDAPLPETIIKTSDAAPPIEKIEAIKQPAEIVSLHEIPLNVRQHIPAMEFSAHVYSTNAAQRSLVINGRFMEEGDSISNDLILNEITSDGAIFDFQGHRFSASVLSGWNIN